MGQGDAEGKAGMIQEPLQRSGQQRLQRHFAADGLGQIVKNRQRMLWRDYFGHGSPTMQALWNRG